MKRTIAWLFVAGLLAAWNPSASAVELLTNGDLSLPENAGDHDEPVGWVLTEGAANEAFNPQNTAQLIGFADRTGSGQGLWLREFEGLFFGNKNEKTNVVLSQTVPGSPGLTYNFSGWARFEPNFSGGVSTLAAGSPSGAVPSPTGTFFEMRFLDASNAGLSSVLLDLRAAQSADNAWHQHVLSGVAPAGTANVLVTAYALNMIPNVDPGQSAFFDDFSLQAVPEPSSIGLGALALLGLVSRARRRS